MSERMEKVCLIIGRRGSGKTTLIRKLINSSSKPKTLVMDTLDHPSYRDLPTIADHAQLRYWQRGCYRIYGRPAPILASIYEYVHNALVVFEDAAKYLPAKLPEECRNFLIDSKQKGVDVILPFHGFGMVPPDLFRLADTITIFKTNENLAAYKSKIPNFDTVREAYDHVTRNKNPYANLTVETI